MLCTVGLVLGTVWYVEVVSRLPTINNFLSEDVANSLLPNLSYCYLRVLTIKFFEKISWKLHWMCIFHTYNIFFCLGVLKTMSNISLHLFSGKNIYKHIYNWKELKKLIRFSSGIFWQKKNLTEKSPKDNWFFNFSCLFLNLNNFFKFEF